MLKKSQKWLIVLLTSISVTTFVNILLMPWIPIDIPISSFSAVRTMFVAIAERRYHLALVSILVCVLLFLSTVSVRRQHILLPILSILFLICDSIMLLILFIDGLGVGYWKTYIIRITVSITVIVLLYAYLYNRHGGNDVTVEQDIITDMSEEFK